MVQQPRSYPNPNPPSRCRTRTTSSARPRLAPLLAALAASLVVARQATPPDLQLHGAFRGVTDKVHGDDLCDRHSVVDVGNRVALALVSRRETGSFVLARMTKEIVCDLNIIG